MRPWLPMLALVGSLLALTPCTAQTLSSRPAIFADPVLGTDPPLGPCLWLAALVQLRDNLVHDFGYVFTCATTAAPRRAVLDREP